MSPIVLTKNPQQQNLLDLWTLVIKQDEQAFTHFYQQTVGKVYALAYRIVGVKETAEDVVCDVYLQIWQNATHYKNERGNILGWLLMICRSRAIDTLRREHLQQKQTNDSNMLSETSECLYLYSQQKSLISEALQQLNKKQRQLIALAYFKDLSHRELSKVTGLPLGTVKTTLRKALSILRQHLQHYSAEHVL